ncbi:hypothetical protein N6H14_31895 [Paenibacillus sp. CC-CFT747]|nr:hypothetical protein N6H14_31895 [Paenibacillus sp. CC-CFT747]
MSDSLEVDPQDKCAQIAKIELRVRERADLPCRNQRIITAVRENPAVLPLRLVRNPGNLLELA